MNSPSLFRRRALALTLGLLMLAAAAPTRVRAHGGHDHAPGESDEAPASGPIQITAEARKNLGVSTAEAEVRNIEKVLTAFGQITPVPGRQAVVSSRISGRVFSLNVAEGQRVKKGEPVAVIESLQIGDPPPRATYASPIDGIVTARRVVLGSSVDPNTALVEIADPSEVYAEARVFEGQVSAVRVGQKARVNVEAFPGETFEGAVELLGGQLDPESRTLRAWVRLQNPDGKLRPNLQATVHLVTEAGESVTAIPRSAVLGESGSLFVFVETGEGGLTFERRPIVAGIADDRFIEAVEGVLPGDKVVTQGNYQLQYVAAKPPAAASPAPGKTDAHDEPGTARQTPAAGPAAWLRSHWLAVALGVSLLVNLALLLGRSRRAAEVTNPPVVIATRDGETLPANGRDAAPHRAARH